MWNCSRRSCTRRRRRENECAPRDSPAQKDRHGHRRLRDELDAAVRSRATRSGALEQGDDVVMTWVPLSMDGIPAELRGLGWIGWRGEYDREGNLKKIPYQLGCPSRPASNSDPSQWRG